MNQTDAGDYLSAKLILQAAANFTAVTAEVTEEPYHSRLEEAQVRRLRRTDQAFDREWRGFDSTQH